MLTKGDLYWASGVQTKMRLFPINYARAPAATPANGVKELVITLYGPIAFATGNKLTITWPDNTAADWAKTGNPANNFYKLTTLVTDWPQKDNSDTKVMQFASKKWGEWCDAGTDKDKCEYEGHIYYAFHGFTNKVALKHVGHVGKMLFTFADAFTLPEWFSSFRGRGGDFSSATNHHMLQIFFMIASNETTHTWSF
jgi:hypothetical protein